jgi:hypothetical protein
MRFPRGMRPASRCWGAANRRRPRPGHLTRFARTLAAPSPGTGRALEQAVARSAEREEIKRSRTDLKRVARERASLKKAVPLFSQPPPFTTSSVVSKYTFIALPAAVWPVRARCRARGVSTRGYDQWRQLRCPPAPRWQPAAEQAFPRHAGRYGTRRLRAELRAEGYSVGRYALRSWLHRHGLRALSTRPQRPRTSPADPALVVAENLLLTQPAPPCPTRVWVGASTYQPLVGGRWCYRATWRDACSRWVVGWHLAARRPTELVLTALQQALQQALTPRQPAPGLSIHADRGSPSPILAKPAASVWLLLEPKLVMPGRAIRTTTYLDTYFPLDRRHSALGYRSPLPFEANLKLTC